VIGDELAKNQYSFEKRRREIEKKKKKEEKEAKKLEKKDPSSDEIAEVPAEGDPGSLPADQA
jgi:hypothetical protein